MLEFNEWMLKQYGIAGDDLTDDDYDMMYEEYEDYKKFKEEKEGKQ